MCQFQIFFLDYWNPFCDLSLNTCRGPFDSKSFPNINVLFQNVIDGSDEFSLNFAASHWNHSNQSHLGCFFSQLIVRTLELVTTVSISIEKYRIEESGLRFFDNKLFLDP
ncbi:hypothetical protein L596_005832 [Steinernema carpocapsae]|uniref:Uncharacterized protein n=1 Tax=Steinernema carpocapsae TaxID=34508 RepID=A0A4V6I8T3_STECR|nr:hypothetical protein L596_005832 [Steinernema carpocapsae]